LPGEQRSVIMALRLGSADTKLELHRKHKRDGSFCSLCGSPVEDAFRVLLACLAVSAARASACKAALVQLGPDAAAVASFMATSPAETFLAALLLLVPVPGLPAASRFRVATALAAVVLTIWHARTAVTGAMYPGP